jgi:hypothetical protein
LLGAALLDALCRPAVAGGLRRGADETTLRSLPQGDLIARVLWSEGDSPQVFEATKVARWHEAELRWLAQFAPDLTEELAP